MLEFTWSGEGAVQFLRGGYEGGKMFLARMTTVDAQSIGTSRAHQPHPEYALELAHGWKGGSGQLLRAD